MTRRDRVIKALEFEEPDFVPWHIGLTIPVREMLEKHFQTDDVEEALGNHIARISPEPPGSWKEVRPGFWSDEFGVVWDRTIDEDIGNPCEFVVTPDTLSAYSWPDPLDRKRFEPFDEFFATAGDRYMVADIGFSLWERAWTMRGLSDAYSDMVLNEAFLDELLDMICEWNLALIDKLLEYPFDAIQLGDDWGSQRGLLMGPELWQRFIKPRIALMYKRVRDGGKKVFIHSCGDVDELFGELVDLGLNVFNPFQPEVMDTFALAEEFKGRLAFFGGISTQKLLPYGTPDEVRAEVKRILKGIGSGGGYIASPAHDTPKDVPLENMLAMLEVLQNQ